jgi:hypothetical protein
VATKEEREVIARYMRATADLLAEMAGEKVAGSRGKKVAPNLIEKAAKKTAKVIKKKKRMKSAYNSKYAKAFKKVASKYKKKSGGWKKDGFKRAQKEAHAMAKRMR